MQRLNWLKLSDNRGLIAFIFLADLCILLDIPLLRQILGFILLTFIPGWLILSIIKLDKLKTAEQILLCEVLSLSLIMIFGLAINNFYPSVGIARPINSKLLLINLNILFLIMIFAAQGRIPTFKEVLKNFFTKGNDRLFLIIPIIIPSMMILAVHLMNIYKNNNLILISLSIIIVYTILLCYFKEYISDKIYVVTILSYSLSILFMWAARSNYIVFGADTDWEYYLYTLTLADQHWQVNCWQTVDACLSISLLPSIYQVILNVDRYDLFRFLYPLLFATSPLAIYSLSSKYLDKNYAFMSSLLFISFYNFFTTNNRNNIALLFFASTVIILFHEGMREVPKRFLFILLSISSIISHYSTSYIFFFIMIFSMASAKIIGFYCSKRRTSSGSANLTSSMPLTVSSLTLFIVVLYIWYADMTKTPFTSGILFISRTISEMNNIFLLESRSSIIQYAAGQVGVGGIPGMIEYFISWLVVFSIGTGILFAIIRIFKRGVTHKYGIDIDSLHSIDSLDINYLSISLISFFLLCISVLLPRVSKYYDISRIYFQVLIILSSFSIIGLIVIGLVIYKGIRIQPHWTVLFILLAYFMCTTGFMYEVSGVPRSLVLNESGNQYRDIIIHDQEAFSAKWLSKSANMSDIVVYTDSAGRFRVILQGLIPAYLNNVDNRNLFTSRLRKNSYIYFRYDNVMNNRVLTYSHERQNVSDYDYIWSSRNKIYGNGGSDILY